MIAIMNIFEIKNLKKFPPLFVEIKTSVNQSNV